MAAARDNQAVLYCSRCRLAHLTPVRRCRHCGTANPVAPGSLLVHQRRWKLISRTPLRRSLRILDALFIGLLVLAPFETDRRDPSWTIPVLFILLGLWALVRLAIALLSRFRLTTVQAAATLPSVGQPAAPEGPPAFSGTIARLKETVDAPLGAKRCLAYELWVAPTSTAQSLRLRRVDASPFLVRGEGGTYLLRGMLRLHGVPSTKTPTIQTAAVFGVELDSPFFQDAEIHQLILDSRDQVAVWGGIHGETLPLPQRRKSRAETATIVEGRAGSPIYVTILRKGGAAG